MGRRKNLVSSEICGYIFKGATNNNYIGIYRVSLVKLSIATEAEMSNQNRNNQRAI